MFKPLTLSLGLAVALGTCSLSVAGLHDKPSAQDPMPSAQIMPSEQGGAGCDLLGPAKKHCSLFDLFKHKPKCYTYEWVLKKKRVRHGLFGLGDCGSCGDSAGCGDAVGCDLCGETIYPSGQGPSAQGAEYAAPQGGYAAPQYGATQMLGSGQITAESVLAPATGGVAAPAAVAAPVDPAMEPPPAPRELGLPEAPAIPSVPEVPAVPDAPVPAAPSANAGGLLYLPSAG